ncbi:nucleotidyltransferase domain-containing protein [Microlunatus soli]|uniref:Streptomycin adenylyltransferase n=1 Tax=Microlunatus soli TaxID=630515 RepID=A0A1H2ACQ7_9ACTN|nr:nucleotidyltransferase domain-containing protein [Microlunatus soli]SDT43751.1 Streptomycin adenylyltransferase [Microlunatus soli]
MTDWLDTLPLPWQRRCIETAIEILPTCQGVRAVWVAGSLARGEGDQYSDVDLNCLITDDSIPFWRAQWSEVVARCVGNLTLSRTINDAIIGGFSLTSNWEHVDLILHPLTSFAHRPTDHRTLYDPDRLIESAPRSAAAEPQMDVGDMSEFFFYLAGSFATVIGRGELALAQDAVIDLRRWLVRLMLAENRLQPFGGARRLNPLLTAEQRAELEHVGALASLDDVTAAAAAIFSSFASRAERISRRDGIEFPQQMYEVTRHHLHQSLGVDGPAPAG